MKVVTFDGLGQFSFDQPGFDDDEKKDHPFNEEQYQGRTNVPVCQRQLRLWLVA